jgi:hypothetical protein
MKSFSVFECELPELKPGESVVENRDERDLFGSREIRTSITLIAKDYNGYTLLEAEHSFVQAKSGRAVAFTEDGKFREFKFGDYIEDVRFRAFYSAAEKTLVLETTKETAKDFYETIKNGKTVKNIIPIRERIIDFDKLEPLIGEYQSVFFKGIQSGGIRSASLSGTKLKQHTHFTDYKESGGKLTYVTFPFVHGNAAHHIGITQNSGIVLMQRYDNIVTELDLVMAIKKNLFEKAWEEELPIQEESIENKSS